MLGSILNPTAGTSLDCGMFSGNFFNAACWCNGRPSWMSASGYAKLCGDISTPQQAAQAAATLGDPSITAVDWQAPGLPAVPGGYIAGNETVDQYDAEVANSWKAWAGDNAHVMDDVWNRIQLAGEPTNSASGLPTWAWIAIAATAGVLVIGGLRR